MKERTRGFIAGFLLCALLIGLGIPVGAATYKKAVEIYYRDVKITLDGQQVTPKDAQGQAVEPFIMDGTTYLPVRGIASALGMGVDWDNSTSTVKLHSDGNSGVLDDVYALLDFTGHSVWSQTETVEIIHGDTPTETWKDCMYFLGDGRFYCYQYSLDSTSDYGIEGEYNVVDGCLNIVYQIDYNQNENTRDIYKIRTEGNAIVLESVSGAGLFTGKYTQDEEWTQYDIGKKVDEAFHKYDDAPYK